MLEVSWRVDVEDGVVSEAALATQAQIEVRNCVTSSMCLVCCKDLVTRWI